MSDKTNQTAPDNEGGEQEQSPIEVMKHYAFVDENSVCYSVSSITADLEISDRVILLEHANDANLGDKYENGVWIPSQPKEPQPDEPTIFERLKSIEAENAELSRQNVELWEILITQGVI